MTDQLDSESDVELRNRARRLCHEPRLRLTPVQEACEKREIGVQLDL